MLLPAVTIPHKQAGQTLHGLVDKIRGFISSGGLLPQSGAIVVGLSGGPDSVALLRILLDLRDRNVCGWKIVAAHLNHKIRGGDADKDAAFCRRLCKSLALPLVLKTANVPALARRRKLSIEEAAREARFAFFENVIGDIAKENHGRPIAIALGHHRDDQAETVLLRILRGTGITGLAGIPARRELAIPGTGAPVWIARPLLTTTRKDILRYLKNIRQPFRQDRSNLSTEHTRNRVRNELIPHLRQRYNPQVTKALANLAQIARQWSDAMESGGKTIAPRGSGNNLRSQWRESGRVRLDAAAIAALAPAAAQNVVLSVLRDLKIPLKKITADHFRRILALCCERAPRTVQLPEGFDFHREKNHLVLEKRSRRKSESARSAALTVGRRNDLPELGVRLTVKNASIKSATKNFFSSKSALEELIDRDAITGGLTARHPRRGDIFRPLGRKNDTSLAGFLARQGLTPHRRARAVVVADEERIVWVVGVRISEDVKISSGTKRLLRLKAEFFSEDRK